MNSNDTSRCKGGIPFTVVIIGLEGLWRFTHRSVYLVWWKTIILTGIGKEYYNERSREDDAELGYFFIYIQTAQ
jgi:hypothetical protein